MFNEAAKVFAGRAKIALCAEVDKTKTEIKCSVLWFVIDESKDKRLTLEWHA